MADHSITVDNTLTFHGHGYPSIWNAVTWNAFTWGWSSDSETRVEKVIDSTATPTTDVGKYVIHWLDSEGVTLDSAVENAFVMAISEALSVSSDRYSAVLTDSNGYTHVFPSDATDAEDRDIPTWTSGTVGSVSWTSGTVAATSWS